MKNSEILEVFKKPKKNLKNHLAINLKYMYSSLKIHWKNFSTIKVKKLRLNQVDSTTIYANSFYLKIMQVFCDQIDKASNN